MDSDQDLHKAYGDIMLKASKEADAKVVAAERKAQSLEHQLQATKDEAVQMMVRLKKIMDDKIREAKMTSQNQQEKIEELEAQLQEAEDIVSELREELRYVQAQCERLRVSRNDMDHLDKHDNATPKEESEDNRQSQSLPCHPLELEKDSLVASDKENLYLNQRAEYTKCSAEAIRIRNLYGAMPELPSILLRSKEDKFYRTGCTQRIQACESNILDSELSISRQPNGASGKGKVEGDDSSTYKVTTDEAQKMFNIASREEVCKDGCISCQYEVQTIELMLNRVKTAINTKDKNKKIISSKKIPDRLFRKLHETPAIVENSAQPSEDPTPVAPRLPSDMTGMVTQLECGKTTQISYNDKEGDIEKLISKGESPVVPIVQKGTSTECSDIQVLKSPFKKVNKSIPPPELKTKDATIKGSSLQLFKYTFQRKRKRIFDENFLAENRTPAREKVKHNISAEKRSLAW